MSSFRPSCPQVQCILFAFGNPVPCPWRKICVCNVPAPPPAAKLKRSVPVTDRFSKWHHYKHHFQHHHPHHSTTFTRSRKVISATKTSSASSGTQAPAADQAPLVIFSMVGLPGVGLCWCCCRGITTRRTTRRTTRIVKTRK